MSRTFSLFSFRFCFVCLSSFSGDLLCAWMLRDVGMCFGENGENFSKAKEENFLLKRYFRAPLGFLLRNVAVRETPKWTKTLINFSGPRKLQPNY